MKTSGRNERSYLTQSGRMTKRASVSSSPTAALRSPSKLVIGLGRDTSDELSDALGHIAEEGLSAVLRAVAQERRVM